MNDSFLPPLDLQVDPPPRRPSRWRRALVPVAAIAIVVLGATAVLARIGRPYAPTTLVPVVDQKADEARLAHRAARAESRLHAYRPRGMYLVVDTYRNRLHVIRDGKEIRTAICSTGTGMVLRDPRTGKEWVFDTPMGERRIVRKLRNPVWAKPDWAFIEEGLQPPKDPNERFDPYSLGDFGIYLSGGDGYIIHGTLFKTLLGRPATHGCIRLGDDDLEYVYRHAPLGTRVFLY